VGLPAEAAHRVFDRPGAAHRVVVGRHPASVCGPLPVSFVCGGLALVGLPLTFVGVPLALIGQPLTFVGVLVAPGPSLPTRLAGAGTLIGGPSTLNRLIGWTGRISRAFLVVQMALLGRVGDASALLVTDGTARVLRRLLNSRWPMAAAPDHGRNIRVPPRGACGCTCLGGSRLGHMRDAQPEALSRVVPLARRIPLEPKVPIRSGPLLRPAPGRTVVAM
jgi:hypothetical protein